MMLLWFRSETTCFLLFLQHGICYFVSEGTLLGLARHGSFMAHDADVDLVITESEVQPAIQVRLVLLGRHAINPTAAGLTSLVLCASCLYPHVCRSSLG